MNPTSLLCDLWQVASVYPYIDSRASVFICQIQNQNDSLSELLSMNHYVWLGISPPFCVQCHVYLESVATVHRAFQKLYIRSRRIFKAIYQYLVLENDNFGFVKVSQ